MDSAPAADHPNSKNAWVVLLMMGDAYAPGALVVAQSLRDTKTKHDIVCMVTHDVSLETRAQLRGTPQNPIYDDVIEVPYIVHPTRPLQSKKQVELYGGWIDRSFTKWSCLKFTWYHRVIFVDADMVVVANCDDLFELRPPAACYSNPWAYPWADRGGITNPYLTNEKGRSRPPAHGACVPAAQIEKALHSGSFVGWGAVVLLEPNAAKFEDLLAMIHKNPVFGEEFNVVSGSDEVSIAALYAQAGWTHIHQRYLAIPWKPRWVPPHDVCAYHFHGRKPWEMAISEWPDLAIWWQVVGRLIARCPKARQMFYPKAVAGLDDARIG